MKKSLKPVADNVLYNSNHCFQGKDPLLCTDDLNYDSLLSIWMKYYGGDPRIALGRYSPLEKEIMRLGGVHTVATRRLLAQKQREEETMLKELRQKSPDYKKAMEFKKENFILNTGKKNMEKTWTAKIIVPREEFRMPMREKTDISKHIERMKLGRRLQDKAYSKLSQSSSFLPAVTPDSNSASEEKEDDEASSKVNKTEIEMKVIFKADEPKIPIIISTPYDRKPFDIGTKLERKIAGHTNRIRFPHTDFPGDLLLLNQSYKSTRIHLNDDMKSFLLSKEGHWKNCLHNAFEDSPHS